MTPHPSVRSHPARRLPLSSRCPLSWRSFEWKSLTPVGAPPTMGRIEGYASLFGVEDMSHDIVMAGAFRTSLARRGAGGIKLLWQHDPSEPIGRWLSITEDARGLKVTGEISLEISRGREAFSLVQAGILDGLSIGFRTVTARKDARTGVRRLDQVDLWEISLVTFPMLPGARVLTAQAAATQARPAPALDDLTARRMRQTAALLRS